MIRAAVLSHMLEPSGNSTLLGGEPPIDVINSDRYTPPLTTDAHETDQNLPSIDQAILTALSGGKRTVLLVGPEGSGKTTALVKLVVDWAKGEHLQSFATVLHFQLGGTSCLEGALCLETLIQRHYSHIPPADILPMLERAEDVLFVFDGLDEYKPSLDPADYTLCTDPRQTVSGSCIVASLLHGSLLKGAAFVVGTRPSNALKFLSGTRVKVSGFLKPQREAYFTAFFTDPDTADTALVHMERTVGFYDFSTAPRFCWTVCSVYKFLMESEANLPETLTQLMVEILVQLLQTLSLSEAGNRELVSALGRMASHHSLEQSSGSAKEQIDSFGLQRFLTAIGAFLRIDGNMESDGVVSFHSKLIQDFMLALHLFLDKSPNDELEKKLEQHKQGAEFLDFFLSGLSEPLQRRPLETQLGAFNTDQIEDFKRWFKSSSKVALAGFYKHKHHRCFHLLHQAQNDSLVKEIITSTARIGISYGGLSLRDCVALNYVVSCLGAMETLNLYQMRGLTEEAEKILAPAMRLSHTINLSSSSLSPGGVAHLASALRGGVTKELDLAHSSLSDEKLKTLCSGLRESKLQQINLQRCNLTEASCDDLASVLASNTSDLRVLRILFNEIGDEGLSKLCKALWSPHCKLEELQVQHCNLSAVSMEVLSAVLCSGQSGLRKINLTQNHIGDNGVEYLCKSLQHPLCKLQCLTIYDNQLSGACCPHVKAALMSEHCCLSELDLSVNELGQEGALQISQALSRPGCPIEKLGLVRCELTLPVFEELGSLLRSGTSQLKSLAVGLNEVGNQGVQHLLDALSHPKCLLEELDVEMTNLTDACLESLCAAIRASKTLKSLELRNNSLTDAAVPALVRVMQDCPNVLELNVKYNDFSDDVFEMLEECERIRY